MSAAREEVLGRIRAALATGPTAPLGSPPAATVDGGAAPSRRSEVAAVHDRQPDELVGRFVERVEDYRATVTPASANEVGAVVQLICARHGVTRLAVPEGVPVEWVPPLEVLAVGGAIEAGTVRTLDAVDGVLTASALGVAETGTIVLDGGPGQGPRAATLLPDLHLCVVRAADIVAGVPELTAWMGAAVRAHGRPLTLVSGPSATSDIELDRVEGVHGPRRLEVVLVAE